MKAASAVISEILKAASTQTSTQETLLWKNLQRIVNSSDFQKTFNMGTSVLDRRRFGHVIVICGH